MDRRHRQYLEHIIADNSTPQITAVVSRIDWSLPRGRDLYSVHRRSLTPRELALEWVSEDQLENVEYFQGRRGWRCVDFNNESSYYRDIETPYNVSIVLVPTADVDIPDDEAEALFAAWVN